ncbi:hypothetical protein Hypma_014022 [Hypsizygus marmoreus]|uniref:Uncharacterized protein n=1 Tax=Hypsizygus marmoreus TaxID=39966 RepID=A0A369KGN2_HYPMA|nr:hypothetical protein Hypma_014022 [Hypsizygus marmoreus]
MISNVFPHKSKWRQRTRRLFGRLRPELTLHYAFRDNCHAPFTLSASFPAHFSNNSGARHTASSRTRPITSHPARSSAASSFRFNTDAAVSVTLKWLADTSRPHKGSAGNRLEDDVVAEPV